MRMKIGIAIFCLGIMACSPTSESQSVDGSNIVRDVISTLEGQIKDWNNGDVEAFMQSYWNSPEVRFASAGDVKLGWVPVLEQYKDRYPNPEAMGELRTAELNVTPLGDHSAMAFGRWIVTAGANDYCGLFTLILRRVDGRWVIIHDHTSSAGETMADGRTCTDVKQSVL